MAVALTLSDDLAFTVPKVTGRVYITKGPSGWAETFPRDPLDKELVEFLGPVGVDPAVDLFVAARELSDKPEPTTWQTVVGFLSRTMNVAYKLVPHTVGIAFWAHVVIATSRRG